MGIYDREYYREEEERRWRQTNAPLSIVTWIIIINGAFFLANLFFSGELPNGQPDNRITSALTLDAGLFKDHWKVYQIVTAGFVHAPAGVNLFHIIFNMMTLYFLGRVVEQKYGRKDFLAVYLMAIVLGNLAWLGMQHLTGNNVPDAFGRYMGAYGASGGVMAIVLVFCLTWPREQLLLFGVVPIPAWSVAALVIGTDVLRAFGIYVLFDKNVAWQAHLAGALCGTLYYLAAQRGFRFSTWGSGRFGKSRRRQPKLTVYDPGEEEVYQDLDAEADRVLAKLHREGEGSLSPQERKVLEAYSRRMRQKHR